MKSSTKKLISIKEAIIIALILIGAIILYFFIVGDEGQYARITLRGYPDMYLNLQEEGMFPLPQNPNVVFEVSGGGISFFSSDCPDQICVNIGQITRAGQVATCLPNLVSIAIISAEEDDIDIIAR